MMKHKKKGTSLAIVFIISTVIMLMLMTSFMIVGNYNISIISRKYDLGCKVYPTNPELDCRLEDIR